ncbi:amino acid ABC transporter ATP-binding protein [Paraburkholderia sp. MPAMCS5]|uniref:amino acid ABC transporter ATP-binding protein n=1 Tax=Paraburkholderia sp. MPAMCS5 TaxID=3112563 RepID=UPI002E1812F2|nr:amino acid ABC transporter ATP-binding protein [Paraburkholderia sp. MPAMCS5]
MKQKSGGKVTNLPGAESPLLVIDEVRKSFGNHEVLKGISFSVKRSQVIGLLGRSGSGKSTLLRCMNMLERPDSGKIVLDGEEIGFEGPNRRPRSARELARQRRAMTMVFQHFNLWPHRTVLQNVIEGPTVVLGEPRDVVVERAMELLNRVGLKDKADAYPIRLSGGQQQRVSIARALAMQPKVILFDEPTSALDPELVGEVLGVMLDLAQSGATMIVVTHEMNFAREACDEVILLANGEIVDHGPPDEVMSRPDRGDTHRLFESAQSPLIRRQV